MLGDTYQNNSKDNKYEPTVYSEYKMSNIEGIDPSAVSFSFWGKLLKVSISPKKQGDQIAFDHDNAIAVYLSHTRARVLANEIKSFLADPIKNNNVGTATGTNGLIQVSNGKEFGINTPCLIIRKVNSESGKVESAYAYQVKTDYHYGIRNYDEKSGKFDKVYYNNLELEQLVTLLEEYYKAMSGAIAYSLIDNMKYDSSRTNTKIGLIMDKLGIESKSGKSGGNSYFNKNNNSSSNGGGRTFSSSTLDDIAEQMEED